MRAVLLHWHVGCVLGTVQPAFPAWGCSKTPQHLAQAKGRGKQSLRKRLMSQKVARDGAWCPKRGMQGGSGVGSVCCVSAAEAVPIGPPREGDLSPAAVCHQIQPRSCVGCHDNRDRSYDPFHFLNINLFHTVYATPWKPNVEQERLHKNEQNTE